MLPTPTPDESGDASFLGLSRDPNQKADMGSRARTPEAAETAAQKEQPASQPGNAKATKHRKVAAFCGWGRARARQKARKPTRKKQGPRSEPATAKAKRTEQQPTSQHSSF